MKVALQLYTVRDEYNNGFEFKQVLKKVRNLGYNGVEFAGFSGLSAKEIREYMSSIGLEIVASHHSIDELSEKKDEILAYAAAIGCQNVVCSYSNTSTMEEVSNLIQVLKDTMAAAEPYGITISYHNHSHEFLKLENGVIPMDEIKKLCKLEVDSYWVFHANLNPVEYLLHNKNLIQLIHVKDGDLNGNPYSLGTGKNDIKTIINTVKSIGMEWIIVENDNPIPNGLSDAERSYQYLMNVFPNEF